MKKPTFIGFQKWLEKNNYDELHIQSGDLSEAYKKYLESLKEKS